MELIQPKSIPNRLLHYLALQIEACGAVTGDGEDEGLLGASMSRDVPWGW